MGFDATRWAAEQRTENGYATAVLRWLCDQVRQTDADTGQRLTEWILETTREDIAHGVEFSMSTVRRALIHLAGRWIECQPLKDGMYWIRILGVPIERPRVPTEHQPRSNRTSPCTPYKEPSFENIRDTGKTLSPPVGGKREPDPAIVLFTEAFEGYYGIPPQLHRGDFIQTAKLRQLVGIHSRDAPPDFRRALIHYFETPRASHTLADLCVNYATFRQHALDRYNRPKGEKTNDRQRGGALSGINRSQFETEEVSRYLACPKCEPFVTCA